MQEKKANITPIEVNLFEAESREEYLQINHFAKIPTLITDKGNVLFEANIIIEYIDRHFQDTPRLIPEDPEQAQEVRMLERIIDVYINSGREALFADSQRPVEERGKKEVVKAQRLMETAIALLEERLINRTWLAGEFSACDCAAAPTLAYLRMVYNYNHFPRLTQYVRRLESRASVAQVFQSGREQMTSMLSTLRYPLQLVSVEAIA